MKEFWQSLSTREQTLIQLTLVFLGLLSAYQFVLAPQSAALRAEKQALYQDRDLLQFMKQAQQRLQTAKPNNQANDHLTSLLPAIEKSLSDWGLNAASKNIKQTGKTAQITFERVSAQSLFKWLSHLASDYNITIERLRITRLDQNGQIRADFILAKPA